MSKELINAILDNNDELVKEIICTNNKEILNYQDGAGFTALHFAIQDNKYDYAVQLIEAGANFEIPDMYGNTALIRAVSSFRGDGRIIKLLLAKGADRNKKIIMEYLRWNMQETLQTMILFHCLNKHRLY